MPPKRNPRPIVEFAPEALFDHNRSVYGDNHAATETALLAAHAQHLRNVGAIDEHMVAELTKPYSKPDIRCVRYTTEYLTAHPDYTGEDADAMPTLQSAMKHQRYRDEAQNKNLEDYRAGCIDVWGNPTAYRMVAEERALLPRIQGTRRQNGMLGAYKSHDLPMLGGELVGDTTEVDDSSSDNSGSPTVTRQRHRIDRVQKGNTKGIQSTASKQFTNLPAKGTFSTATPPSFKNRFAHYRYNPDVLPPSITSTATQHLSISASPFMRPQAAHLPTPLLEPPPAKQSSSLHPLHHHLPIVQGKLAPSYRYSPYTVTPTTPNSTTTKLQPSAASAVYRVAGMCMRCGTTLYATILMCVQGRLV